MKKRLTTRKILVASLGIGAVSYVAACGGSVASSKAEDGGPDVVNPTGGNLMGAEPPDSGVDAYNPTGGNLMGYPVDASADTSAADGGANDARPDVVTSGNLMAPIDSGDNGG